MVAEISPSASSPRAVTERTLKARREAADDAVLVSRFTAGDETAFTEIVQRYRKKMFHVAFNLLHNRADAEEIAQDTFIRAHRGLASFRGEASLAAWLYLIALNLARNRYWYFYRRRRHLALPLDAAMTEGSSATFAELVPSEAPGPVREAANNEFSAIAASCMAGLTVSQREVLMLRVVRHLPYSHISHQLGVSVGTVKSRIARARRCLRLLVGKAYPGLAKEDASSFDCFEPVRSAGHVAAVCA